METAELLDNKGLVISCYDKIFVARDNNVLVYESVDGKLIHKTSFPFLEPIKQMTVSNNGFLYIFTEDDLEMIAGGPEVDMLYVIHVKSGIGEEIRNVSEYHW